MKVAIIGANGQLGSDLVEVFGDDAIALTHQDLDVTDVESLKLLAGARGKGGNFVEFMIQKAKNEEELKVVDDQFMSPTYTKDVAEMLKKFLAKNPAFGVYHMVNDGYCSWYEFTKEIFTILGVDVHIVPIKSSELTRLARRPVFSALKNSKLEELGLRMRTWREALGDYLIEKGRRVKKETSEK